VGAQAECVYFSAHGPNGHRLRVELKNGGENIYMYVYTYKRTHVCCCKGCEHTTSIKHGSATHTHTHTHTHIHTHTHTYTHIHTHTYTHIHTYTYIHIRTHARAHTHTHAQTHTHRVRACKVDQLRLCHTHTHTHARTHAHTHTHTHTLSLSLSHTGHEHAKWINYGSVSTGKNSQKSSRYSIYYMK